MRENGEKLLTVQEASRALGVTAKSVRDFIASGELRASKIGQWKIGQADLDAFVESRSARRPGLEVSLDVRVVARLDKVSALAQSIIELIQREGQTCEFSYQLTGGAGVFRLTAPPAFLGRVLNALKPYAPVANGRLAELALDRE
ncbi:MAG TPA: helix-turn-helix domain-containing protein [Bacillota bacterium]|jgi:excisionase family DNA binding protein